MKVRMRTTAAGPDGVLSAGREYDLPSEKGKQLVQAGYAEIVKSEKAKNVVEVANLESAPETTSETKSKRPGRQRADTPESGRR